MSKGVGVGEVVWGVGEILRGVRGGGAGGLRDRSIPRRASAKDEDFGLERRRRFWGVGVMELTSSLLRALASVLLSALCITFAFDTLLAFFVALSMEGARGRRGLDIISGL